MADAKHGVQGRRQWPKIHLAMGTTTSGIRAVDFTPGSDGDSLVLPESSTRPNCTLMAMHSQDAALAAWDV